MKSITFLLLVHVCWLGGIPNAANTAVPFAKSCLNYNCSLFFNYICIISVYRRGCLGMQRCSTDLRLLRCLACFDVLGLHSKRGDIFYLILLRTYVAIAQHAELGINL